jgi:hypothetical protein
MFQASDPSCGKCQSPTELQCTISKLGTQPELHVHRCLTCDQLYFFQQRDGAWQVYSPPKE